jgi:hypothetical protein
MVELSRFGDYARRTWQPADGVIIRGEMLSGIPRVFIETGGYDYISISWTTNKLRAGYFGLDNIATTILDFPAFTLTPSGWSIRNGPNLLHIGGNQFATGPAAGFGADRVAIVSVAGKNASVEYLPRWRNAGDDTYGIVLLQYGGRTLDGAKRVEYLSLYRYFMDQHTYPYEVAQQPTNTFYTNRYIDRIDMYAFSSTTPLGSAISINYGGMVEEALANPPPVDPVFWISDGRVLWVSDTTPSTLLSTVIPGTPAPDTTYYHQWNWRRNLNLNITATVEVDTDQANTTKTIYTTVFEIKFVESIQSLFWDGRAQLDINNSNPVYVPGLESADIVSAAAAAAQLPGVDAFEQVSGLHTYTPWAMASTAGVYREERRHMVEASAKIISVASENLGGGRIALLLLTERNDSGAFISGSHWGTWTNDNTPGASGKSYLYNMVTITSNDSGQSWHATITRRTVGVSPFPDRLQYLRTLLYIGGNTLLAFGSMYTGLTVWRSTDAGTSYSMLVPPGGIPALPADNMAICLAPGVAGFFNEGKFHRSIDSGATWTTYTVPTDVMPASRDTFNARIAIRAIGETYATTKLAIAVYTGNASGYPAYTSHVFLSDNGGETWRLDATIGKGGTLSADESAIGINIGALNTGLSPNPGIPGMYDNPPSD